MHDTVAPWFSPWESFYVIVGSSGAALTGIQFVVITLVADVRRRSTSAEINAFGTPTIVHFCAALLMAAVLSAPWHALSSPAVVLGVLGMGGIGYVGVVTRRARRQTGYRLVLEDWIWHTVLPFLAYGTLLSGATALIRYAVAALFAIATSSVVLLFIGIHNAWDAVTYVAVEQVEPPEEPQHRSSKI